MTGDPSEFFSGGEMAYDEAVAVLQRLANAALPGTPLEPPRPFQEIAGISSLLPSGHAIDPSLHWQENTFRQLLESLPDALIIMDRRGTIVLVNSQTEKLFGYQRNELLQWPIELVVPERFRRAHVTSRDRYIEDPHVRPMGAGLELFGRKKDGTEIPVEISLSPLPTDAGLYVISTIRDISEKKRLEARYRTLVEEIPAVTFLASLDGGLSELYVSPQIEELLGFSQKEWLENPILWYTQLHEDDQERWHQEFALTLNRAEPFRSVYRFRARDGRVVWVYGEAKVGRDSEGNPLFLQGIAFDITDRKEAEEALRQARDELENKVQERTAQLAKSLGEKDVLLKEVHHRVKNNLQLISTMHRTQARFVPDVQTRTFFEAMQDRLKSIADIHEDLYQAENLVRIDFGQYVRRLASNLVRSFRPEVRLTIEIQNVFLGIDTAIPCGLIINELVSNSLKYAFPDEPGEIEISARSVENKYFLMIRDNGVGFPADLKLEETESLGLEIVASQVNKLDGSFQLVRNPGTTFTITFEEKPER